MNNLRLRQRPADPEHEDFDWMRSTTPPALSTTRPNNKMWRKYCARVREGWDFGLVHWGKLGRETEVSIDVPGNITFIRDVSDHRKVREIMRSIDWENIPGSWMGAPNMDPVDVVTLYEEKKQEWIQQNRL